MLGLVLTLVLGLLGLQLRLMLGLVPGLLLKLWMVVLPSGRDCCWEC